MARDLVTLAECPVGLFRSASGELCLKTEYGNNEGRIDAYIVASGEFFWGAPPQTIASQRSQMVRPVDLEAEIARLTAENARLRKAIDTAIGRCELAAQIIEQDERGANLTKGIFVIRDGLRAALNGEPRDPAGRG